MPRTARTKSESGIYHIMMRGSNRQDIFLDDDDKAIFLSFIKSTVAHPLSISGKDAGEYEIYAYALMSNHFHILIRVVSGSIGNFVKRVAAAYVLYFNKKYHRDGHLFKERFKSEPCNTEDYFNVLLRYIHQNPIKAGLTSDLSHYKYTSWNEYANPERTKLRICNTKYVLQKWPLDKLHELVYDLLPENTKCIDIDKSRGQISDSCILRRLSSEFGIEDINMINSLDKKRREEIIIDLLRYGAGVCQLVRLINVSKSVALRLKDKEGGE